MRLEFLAPATLVLFACFAQAKENPSAPETEQVSAAAVLRELNLAREHPSLYSILVAEARPSHMIEHGHAVDEAVRFLKKTRPLPPLTLSAGMCRAAADHCAEQIDGQLGHDGNDRSSPGDRISRYGTWSISWGENISYGQKTARGIVLTLIIDDGVRSRGHRKNIFNPKFNFAGAAFGPHARYRTVCSIDFAGGYADRAEPLVARNP
ncbi:MAG: CAP domain-containing protein [Verrucomicrobia bacterium]|nr:MAG: CAP domain-containing protein [Verrucomicrobiota bacterium]